MSPFAAHPHAIIHTQWVLLWSAGFAIGWLLPAGFLPWPDFHPESWYTGVFLIAATTLLWRTRGAWALPPVVPPLLALALVPLLQWASGLIYFAGVAWMTCAFLAALALVLWCSHRWETLAPGQGLDGLFMAVGLAAFLTALIQCYQWLGQVGADNWWMLHDGSQRPAGNFAQPNMAATFLCWGLCAVAWAAARRRLGFWAAGAAAAFLLWGVALTGSRTAWLGLFLVLLGTLFWRDRLPTRRVLWLVLALAVYFALCVVLLTLLNAGASEQLVMSGASLRIRLQIWQMGLQALLLKPWWGYGWSQTFAAQLAVADQFPAMTQYFTSTHNLVLDLLLWNGLPLGAVVVLGGGYWLVGVLRRVRTAQDMVLVLFMLLVLNHAMLELPLHYAYMLLPLGWVVGAVEQRMGAVPARRLSVPSAFVVLAVAVMTALLTLIVTDYLHVEESLRDKAQARLEARVWQLPELRVLTHLRAEMEIAQYPVLRAPIAFAELQRLEAIAALSPKAGSGIMVAGALAMNGQPERARWWLARICKVMAPEVCAKAHANWTRAAATHPEIAAIDWPDEAEDAAKP
jgi:O-antigen ligase